LKENRERERETEKELTATSTVDNPTKEINAKKVHGCIFYMPAYMFCSLSIAYNERHLSSWNLGLL